MAGEYAIAHEHFGLSEEELVGVTRYCTEPAENVAETLTKGSRVIVTGDVVTVKNGFARNYLLPNKKALRANESNRKLFEANRARIEEDNASRRSDAQAAAKDVDGKTVQLIRQASNTGQLYGSVSARDIVEALEAEGAHVTKSQIVLDRPIKAIGMHDVRVVLHPEVTANVKVNVASVATESAERDDTLKTPYSHTFNVVVGHELGKSFSVEAAYVVEVFGQP